MTQPMRSRYVTIRPDGTTLTRDFPHEPDSADSEVMSWLHSQVGGWMEHVQVQFDGHHRHAYIHEEGKLERLPFNRKATELWCAFHGVNPANASDVIVGPMVVEIPL